MIHVLGMPQAVTKTDGVLADVCFSVGNSPLLQVLRDLHLLFLLPFVPSLFFSPPEKEEDSHSYQNIIIGASQGSDLGRCCCCGSRVSHKATWQCREGG